MRKVLSLLLVLILASFMALSGCGGGSSNNEPAVANEESPAATEQPAAEKPPEPVEVRLAGWGASPEEQALLQQTLDDFEAKNPDVKVKFEVIADQYMDVIRTRLIGGEGPDVFYLDAFEAPKMIEDGVLEPLDSFITGDFDVNDFEAPLLNAFKSPDGKQYGFPKGFSTLALFYNKKMFADNGIAAPPATWEEFLEVSEKLTKRNGDNVEVYGFGVAPDLARQMYMLKAYGGRVVDENGHAAFASPEALKGLQLIIDQHVVAKTSARGADLGIGWEGEMFGSGKAAMIIEGNWAIPYLKNTFGDLEYGTAEVPTVNGQKGTMAFTVAYVMNKESKQKEAAWKLLSYLTGKEGMETWTSKGFELPSRKSVAAKLGFDKDPIRGALIAGASYATPWQSGPTLPTVASNFNNQFLSAYNGEKSLEEALKTAQEDANKEIDASK